MSIQGEHEQADATHDVSNATEGSTARLEPSSEHSHRSVSPVLPLPEIPRPNLDLGLDLSSIIGSSETKADVEKVQKRASNVLKLSQENEKLKAELKAMTDRLEAAERRREELAGRQQTVMDAPSS